MPKLTFDTNFIIAHKLESLPKGFLFSDVVLLELIRSCQDETTFREYQTLRRLYLEDDLLIIPTSDDWLMAGKVLYWIERGIARKNKGKPPKKGAGETQKMVMDALIAISARRCGVTVVSANVKDMEAINYYAPFKFINDKQYFEKYS